MAPIRAASRDYRTVIAPACHRHATGAASLAVVLYDVTSLHFEVDRKDTLRKVGLSKEHRVDPQVTVGLLTTATGFPLEADLFEGKKAGTRTWPPGPAGRLEDSIQAHLTIVFAAPGRLPRGPGTPGWSISRVLKLLRPSAQPPSPSAPSK